MDPPEDRRFLLDSVPEQFLISPTPDTPETIQIKYSKKAMFLIAIGLLMMLVFSPCRESLLVKAYEDGINADQEPSALEKVTLNDLNGNDSTSSSSSPVKSYVNYEENSIFRPQPARNSKEQEMDPPINGPVTPVPHATKPREPTSPLTHHYTPFGHGIIMKFMNELKRKDGKVASLLGVATDRLLP